jgi:hypothetical protein
MKLCLILLATLLLHTVVTHAQNLRASLKFQKEKHASATKQKRRSAAAAAISDEHLAGIQRNLDVLMEANQGSSKTYVEMKRGLESRLSSRKLMKDVDRMNDCFVDEPRSLDFFLDPFKANNDRGDWGKCMPHEVFGVLCEHMEAHKINNGQWMSGDGPLHDPPSEQLFLQLMRMHDDYCIHLDVDFPQETQSHLNDFLKYQGVFYQEPPLAPCSNCNFTVVAVQGKYWLNGVQQMPLTLTRGRTYYFDTTAVTSVHPFRIGLAVNEHYTNGVTEGADELMFTVPQDAPVDLVYYCALHQTMGADITVPLRTSPSQTDAAPSINPTTDPTTAPTAEETLNARFQVTVDNQEFAMNGVRGTELTLQRGVTYTFDTTAVPIETPLQFAFKAPRGVCEGIAEWDDTEKYRKSDMVLYNGIKYESEQFNKSPFNPTRWMDLGFCPTLGGLVVVEGEITFTVPEDTPNTIIYYSNGRALMGQDITIPPLGSATDLRRTLQHAIGYNTGSSPMHMHNMTEYQITYDMACVQRYESVRFNFQMSIYCALAFFDVKESTADAFFEKDYEMSDTCMKMLKSTYVNTAVSWSASMPPYAFCESDVQADTCMVHAELDPYYATGRTCKAYCEGYAGLTCVAAYIPTSYSRDMRCEKHREIGCDTVQKMGDDDPNEGNFNAMLCTCGSIPGYEDTQVHNEEQPLLASTLVIMDKAQESLKIIHWGEAPRICSQNYETGAVRMGNLPRDRGTCKGYCESHGLSCVAADINWSQTCLIRDVGSCDDGPSEVCGGKNDGCTYMLEGDGDCDSDSDCVGGLKCGTDNCADFRYSNGWQRDNPIGWDTTDDCCYLPTSNAKGLQEGIEDKRRLTGPSREEDMHRYADSSPTRVSITAVTMDYWLSDLTCTCGPAPSESTRKLETATATTTSTTTTSVEKMDSEEAVVKIKASQHPLNTPACERMMYAHTEWFIDNAQPFHYCPPNTVVPSDITSNTCAARVRLSQFDSKPRTCASYCEQHTSMHCVGAALARRDSCDNQENLTVDCQRVVDDDWNALCECGFDPIKKAAEVAQATRLPSNACVNMALGGDLLINHQIGTYCDDDISNPDQHTCTVGLDLYVTPDEYKSCDDFCGSFIGMQCVANTGASMYREDRLLCSGHIGDEAWAGENLACDSVVDAYYMGCTCGFIPDTTRSSRYYTGPALGKNEGLLCPAYELNAAGRVTNEDDRLYDKITLTLTPDASRADGSLKVEAARAERDLSRYDIDSYSVDDAEVCEGLEYTVADTDDPLKCSFGSRLHATSNCYGKLEMNFFAAQKACSKRNGHLLKMDTVEEWREIKELFHDQHLSMGLFRNKDFSFEWDGYPGIKVNAAEALSNLTEYSSNTYYGCIRFSTEDEPERMAYKYWPSNCQTQYDYICEANDSGDPAHGGDLMSDEGGFCLWYLDDPELQLPDDESGGFRNTEIAHWLAITDDTRSRHYHHYPEYYLPNLLPLEYGELHDADNIHGHMSNAPNWDRLTLDYLGRKDSTEKFLGPEFENFDFHCHFSPTNFGVTRIYMQQHMLERLYPGSYKKHCFCGYKHVGKVVARCDCTLNGVRSNNCREEHYPLLYEATVKENGEYVSCNNCNNGIR